MFYRHIETLNIRMLVQSDYFLKVDTKMEVDLSTKWVGQTGRTNSLF